MKQIFVILLCFLLLGGCAQKDPSPTAPPITAAPGDATVAPTYLAQRFTLYYGDENAEKFLSREVQVAEITEEIVMTELIAAGVLAEGAAINKHEKGGTQLRVDFNQNFADQVCTMGTSGEYMIIGSTVNTLLSAFHAESVLITINGEILESGLVIYDFPLAFHA